MSNQSPFAHNDTKESPGFLLWQVCADWQRQIAQVLRPYELTQVQFALMASLLWLSRSQSQVTQIQLARQAKLDAMMTSQVLRSLEKRGLITRREHPQDTRAKVLELTDSGKSLVSRALPAVEAADHQFFSPLGALQSDFLQALCALGAT